jgi:hypothetical protein
LSPSIVAAAWLSFVTRGRGKEELITVQGIISSLFPLDMEIVTLYLLGDLLS